MLTFYHHIGRLVLYVLCMTGAVPEVGRLTSPYQYFFCFGSPASASHHHSQNTCNWPTMSRNVVQPDAWVVIRLPNENIRMLQIVPNT